MSKPNRPQQWHYITAPYAQRIGDKLQSRQGFLTVHNRSTKSSAKLKHALTQIRLQALLV